MREQRTAGERTDGGQRPPRRIVHRLPDQPEVHRGDEHGIEFTDGRSEGWPVGRMIEFIEGGGSEPLRLSERAQAYLKKRQSGGPADTSPADGVDRAGG